MVGVAMDAMAVAIHIKYALNLKPHLTSYSCGTYHTQKTHSDDGA